jgi:hypothetical protein
MYTLEQLQQKTFGELKAIGWELNVLPEGDRRRRQSWIDALVNVNPPLLQLLEVSPGVEVDRTQEPITETVEASPAVEAEQVQDLPIESKFGRIVYPKSTAKPIAQNEEARPQFDRSQSADVHNRRSHPAKSDRDSSGVKTEALGSQKGDRVLAVARDCETDRGRVLPDQSIKLVNQAQEPIVQVTETFPGVEVDRVQNPVRKTVEASTGVVDEPIQEYAQNARRDCPRCVGIQSLYWTRNFGMETWVICCLYCDYERLKDPREAYLAAPEPIHGPDEYPTYKEAIRQASAFQAPPPSYTPPGDYCCTWAPLAPSTQTFSGVDSSQEQIDIQRQEPIAQAAQNSPDVEVDQLPDCVECFGDGYLEDESGLIKSCQCSASAPKLSRKMTQRAIVPASKNLPGSRSKTTAHQLLELFKSSAHIIEDSPGVKTEAAVRESAIVPAAKNRIKEGSDQNPILTGITLSDRFVTRYTPPQSEIIYFQSDADGQLSLLDFEVESVEEPPDPDDFESLDAFQKAIERWDLEHPSSFNHCSAHCSDHCSDHWPSSVQNEPPDPEKFDSMFAFWAAYDTWDKLSDDDSEPSSVQNEHLEISLDSFCEWAPCPADWYESNTLLEQSKVSELLRAEESSITSDFFIPTFDLLGDRSNRSDEPPDTGIFARLPKPKPPTFPPQASQPKSAQVRRASRNYPATIPKLFHRVVAGTSNQPARSPPGGDPMS